MAKLDTAMVDAVTPAQKEQILDSQIKRIVKAKKEGVTKSAPNTEQLKAEVLAFAKKFNEATTNFEKQAVIQKETISMLTPALLTPVVNPVEQTMNQ